MAFLWSYRYSSEPCDILFTSSYASLRGRTNRPLMYIKRLKQMMIEAYKIYHNIGPAYMGELFKKVEHLYQSRNVKSLKQPRFNTVTYGRDSFTYQGAKEWNILDNFKMLHL